MVKRNGARKSYGAIKDDYSVLNTGFKKKMVSATSLQPKLGGMLDTGNIVDVLR